MDHAHYVYSALPLRASGLLPAGLHVFAVVYLEHWDFEPLPGSRRDPRFVGEFGSFNPDYRSWSQREYGLRIGIFRVLEALRESGITPVVAANSLVLPRIPTVLRHLQEMDAQWLGHGRAATQIMHSDMSLDEQRHHIQTSVSALENLTGSRPKGWISQDWGTSAHTYRLLAEAGLSYTLDWGNDDQPYWMEPTDPSRQALLALPLSGEWDDVQAQWLRSIEPAEHARHISEAARRMALECLQQRRCAVMGLGLHPWVWGMPSRIRHLRALLQQLRQMDLVLSTADRLYAQCAAASPT